MRTWNTAVLVGLAAAIGCHRAPVAQAPMPAGPAEDLAARADSSEAIRRARADSVTRVQRAEADRLAQEEADRAARMAAALRDTLGQRIQFDFDRAEIRPEDRAVMDRKLAILRAHPAYLLGIAGHADERGSDEYNLVLGTRRAAAARMYLVNHGIAADRLDVRSYGEEQPLVAGQDEQSLALNRRDEFTSTQDADLRASPPAATR